MVVTAADREALFVEALRALTDCITDVRRVRSHSRRAVSLTAADAELLLVEWLSDALYRFDVEGFLAGGAGLEIADRPEGGLTLRGEVHGEIRDPDRHPHKVAVKAITYHGLEVAPAGAGWRARVIFDI